MNGCLSRQSDVLVRCLRASGAAGPDWKSQLHALTEQLLKVIMAPTATEDRPPINNGSISEIKFALDDDVREVRPGVVGLRETVSDHLW